MTDRAKPQDRRRGMEKTWMRMDLAVFIHPAAPWPPGKTLSHRLPTYLPTYLMYYGNYGITLPRSGSVDTMIFFARARTLNFQKHLRYTHSFPYIQSNIHRASVLLFYV